MILTSQPMIGQVSDLITVADQVMRVSEINDPSKSKSWNGGKCWILFCYTSQLKHVFRLEENASRVVGQNSLTP